MHVYCVLLHVQYMGFVPEINLSVFVSLCVSVSENKVLCHPSSVDSLSTSAGTEDHVSMGGFSARKALMVVEHVEQGKLTMQAIIHTSFAVSLLQPARSRESLAICSMLSPIQFVIFLVYGVLGLPRRHFPSLSLVSRTSSARTRRL